MLDCIRERPDDRLLTDHVVEALGAVLPVQRGHAT